MRCGSCGVDLLVPGGHKPSTVVSKPPKQPAKDYVEVEAIDLLDKTESPSVTLDAPRERPVERRTFHPRGVRGTPIEPERSMPVWAWSVLAAASTLAVAIVVAAIVLSSGRSNRNDPNRAGDELADQAEKPSETAKPTDDAIVGEAPPELPAAPKAPDRSLENDPDALARASATYYKENALWVDRCASILVEHYRFDRVFRVTINGLDQTEERDAILGSLRACFEGMNGAHAEGLVSDRTIKGVFAPAKSLEAFAKGLELGRPIRIDVNENELTITLDKGPR